LGDVPVVKEGNINWRPALFPDGEEPSHASGPLERTGQVEAPQIGCQHGIIIIPIEFGDQKPPVSEKFCIFGRGDGPSRRELEHLAGEQVAVKS
jgi:hypothetical protein